MPLYEYTCDTCCMCQEHLLSIHHTEAVLCECGKPMKRVISRPSPHQLGGMPGKKRGHELIKQRNEAYRKTTRYKDERVRDLEGARRRGLPV